MTDVDVIVIGGGMAGASLGALLAADRRVLLLEAEDRPGFHSTGRSAAIFIQNYGNRVIRSLSAASRVFYDAPPAGFSEHRLLNPRGMLFIADEACSPLLDALLAEAQGLFEVSPAKALERVPILRPEAVTRAAYEADAMDIDVNAVHSGYLRLFKHHGGELVTRARVHALERSNGLWTVASDQGRWRAPVIVNAAGAWADSIAGLAGLAALGLQPLKRTAAIVVPPADYDVRGWPLFEDVAERWYSRPEGGKLMVSPVDETPVEPHDAFADDMDLAEGIDRFQQAVNFEITRVERSWAGLRTFAPDRTPVVGYDPRAEGFFWFAGQGGYGIQIAPGMAWLARALLADEPLPDPLVEQAVVPDHLGVSRLLGLQ